MKKIIKTIIIVFLCFSMLFAASSVYGADDAEIADTNSKVLELTKGKPDFTLNLMTDTHYSPKNSSINNILDLIDNVLKIKNTDGNMHLGDIVNAYDCNALDTVYAINIFKTRLMFSNKLYFVLGNHEGSRISFNSYSKYLTTYNNTYVVRDKDSLYYYFDDSETKTRSIVLQTYDIYNEEGYFGITNKQFEWLKKKALNTTNDIILYGHIPINGLRYEDANALANLIKEYNNTHDNKILIYIAGHTHTDSINLTQYSIPVITIDDSASGNFDTMIYRPDLSKFFFIRTGTGEDREVNVKNK